MASGLKVQTKKRVSYGKDVSIYAYANSPKCSNRASKALTKLDAPEDSAVVESLPDDADTDGQLMMRPGRRKRRPLEDEASYNDYHINLWFHISEYIRPEDVCRFACICRKTAEVVQSGRFWSQLYRSYYDTAIEMPERFQPASMVRRRGLRAAVIRALYYLYPPFVELLTRMPHQNPYRVIGRQLLSGWRKPTKNSWTYCFKLKARQRPGSRPALSAELQREKSSIAFMQDIYMNPEEGCQILLITTNYMKVLPMFGDTLFVKNLTQTLSQGMMRYKVRLELANYCGKTVDELVFDPARDITVLDWWNPAYYDELAWTMPPADPVQELTEDLDWISVDNNVHVV
ncbi:transmembrane protein 183-like [Anopheles albimanus]|uniref:transmembrane protein 183-like n=1 Tax=Anopheles albimanus TaxID=7167 RepID=UPI00163FB9D6|nr:transmembrane protein 183-like [Anopheles albimanus]